MVGKPRALCPPTLVTLRDTAMSISLGIDASVRSSGIALINSGDVVVKNIRPKKLKGSERLHYIYTEFVEFLKDKPSPDIILMEGPSFSSTNKPYMMGEVYGLYKLACFSMFSKEILLPTPKELKKFLAGTGDATKKSMTASATRMGCTTTQEDVCDAFAAALLGMDILQDRNTPGTRKALEVVSKYRSSILGD